MSSNSKRAWGFWKWFLTINGLALSAVGLLSCMQQGLH